MKMYKDRISTTEQNLKLLKKSVEECNVPLMIENSTIFLETIKNANNIYSRLPPKIKENEKNTNRKSYALIEQYFNIKM